MLNEQNYGAMSWKISKNGINVQSHLCGRIANTNKIANEIQP